MWLCTVWEEKFGMRRCHFSSYPKVEKDSFWSKPFRQKDWWPWRHPPGAPWWVKGCARRQVCLLQSHGCEVPVVRPERYEEAHIHPGYSISQPPHVQTRNFYLPLQNPPYLQAFLCLSLASSPFWSFMSQNLAASSFFSRLYPAEIPLAQPSEARRAGLLPALRAHCSLCHCPLLVGHHLPPPCPLKYLLREWPLSRSLRSHQVSAHRSRLLFPWEEG